MNYRAIFPSSPSQTPAHGVDHLPIGPQYEYPPLPSDPPSAALLAVCDMKVEPSKGGFYVLTSKKFGSREEADQAHMHMLSAIGNSEFLPKRLSALRSILNRLIGAHVRLQMRDNTDQEEYRLRIERLTEKLGLDPVPRSQPGTSPFPDDKKS